MYLGASTSLFAGVAALCSAYLFHKVLLASDLPGLAEGLIYHDKNRPLGSEPDEQYPADTTELVRKLVKKNASKNFKRLGWLLTRIVSGTPNGAANT
jgi:hypothetical protein